jgi:hypothetical protein
LIIQGGTVIFIVVKAADVLRGRLTAYGLGCHFTYIESTENFEEEQAQEARFRIALMMDV